jgi:SAM-dependent methyltransferase
MIDQQIRRRIGEEEAAGGPWRSRIRFSAAVHAGPPSPRTDIRSRELFEACRALVPGPVGVLDLGALNGALYAPFADAGCRVTAVDGREANCRKMALLNEARGWGPGRVDVVHSDVRAYPIPEPGDIILCCGLLYHLRVDEAVGLLERLAAAGPRLLVLDSMFADGATARRSIGARAWGYRPVAEPGRTAAERLAVADAAIGNEAGDRLLAGEVIGFLSDRFRPIFQHAVVWEQLPRAEGKCDDPRFRKLLFCVKKGE